MHNVNSGSSVRIDDQAEPLTTEPEDARSEASKAASALARAAWAKRDRATREAITAPGLAASIVSRRKAREAREAAKEDARRRGGR